MKKKPKISTLKERINKVFSLYIRMRDGLRTTGSVEYSECITCYKSLPIIEMDAGHFIQGRHNSVLYDERNCHAQCPSCNRYHNGRQLEYRRQIVKLYGEGVDEELEKLDRQLKQFSVDELLNLEKDLKEKIKWLENEHTS